MKSSPEFVQAAFQLHRERGGGWIPNYLIEERALTLKRPAITLPISLPISLPKPSISLP